MAFDKSPLRVILFSGGRGSGGLTRQLISRAGVSLTIAINGYDDGASTGEVRHFLGETLGPSDFRKNASRVARHLGSCSLALIEALDARFPSDATSESAMAALSCLAQRYGAAPRLGHYIDAFCAEYRKRPRFAFADCSIGNLIFAGALLSENRDFNRALDAYCSVLGLPAGMVEDVTDGRNAHLVALDGSGRLLRSEEEIVSARRRNQIRRIFLVDRPPSDAAAARLEQLGEAEAIRTLDDLVPTFAINPRLAQAIALADLIIYAPGTQHSSLFPSYMTPGLPESLANNLHAIKLLITNIQTDADITRSTAVDLIDRALFYMRLRSTAPLPSPCLITHYLLNEPGIKEDVPYVQLGQVDLIEDPRLVRIGAYEDGTSGLHDAERVLEPFLDSALSSTRRPRVAVLLHDADSADKVTETMLEMVRGRIEHQSIDATVFCLGEFGLVRSFVDRFPFPVYEVPNARAFIEQVRDEAFDYVALFESSGMYRGEDLVALMSHLTVGQLDAVWGSRRLSVRDIRDSYRLRYRHNPVLGAFSFLGSHMLSLACLLLYGRYISDTLSAVRAFRAADALAMPIALTHKNANQYILTRLLRRRADILELPIRFTPLSPKRVHRTSMLEGLHALAMQFFLRF